MESLVLAIQDYEHGGVGMLVRCRDTAGLRHALGPSWELVTENVESHSFYHYTMQKGREIYDFSKPSGLLAKCINIAARQAEGKISVPVRGIHQGKVEYREIWARSAEDIQRQFPSLQLLYGVVHTQEIIDAMGESDIDVPDDFLDRYRT